MCFSATASFAAGTVLLGAGFAAQRLARAAPQRAFAAIPLLFALQQLTEGFVWLSFDWDHPGITNALTQVYSFFSHVLWPAFIPVACWLLEPVGPRRRLLGAISVGGAAVSLYLLYAMVAYPITAVPVGGHIEYVSPHFYVAIVMSLYLAATTLSMLVTSEPLVRLFGGATLAAAVFSYAAYARWFISVWCFFAALLSVIVCLHLAVRARDQSSTVMSRV
ncbi:DUF6629 family protein [Ramlibacter sp. PS3R-8]|uniref:DUF6629 family protein n=1 Tax=Ramlibacter sp. PS3R-8 TaxID=3133437 RepID=UPI0030B3A904